MYHKPTILLVLLLLFLAFSGCFADAAPPQYRVVEIYRRLVLDGPHIVNDFGIVAGALVVPPKPEDDQQHLQTYRWKNGHLTNLKVIEKKFLSSAPSAINDRGQVVGALNHGNGETNFHSWGHAFLWRDGKWQDIGSVIPAEVSYARAINNKGEVAISAQTSSMFSLDDPHPETQQPSYLYRKGQILFLGYGRAIALNNRSQVLLRLWVGGYCIWDSGKTTDIKAFDNADLNPQDMNDQQQIIGQSEKGPFVYANNRLTFLVSDRESYAEAINNHKQIVGYTNWQVPDGPNRIKWLSHAWLWQNAKRYDLNSLIPARSGWVLERATSINDRGMMVGEGVYHGRHTNFLMTPVTRSVESSRRRHQP